MYKLDSGFISIIATIAAIIIGVYSSMNDKKKVQARRKLQADDLSGANEDVVDADRDRDTSERADPAIKMFNNPFEELFKGFTQEEPQAEKNRRVVYGNEVEEDDLFDFAGKEPQVEVKPVAPVFEPIPVFVPSSRQAIDMPVVAEYVYDNGMESIENSGVSMRALQPGTSNEISSPEADEIQPEDSLKERIKRSPKDLVIFAEVLRPKYQEF